MTEIEDQYWPFEVLPPDRRTEADETVIRFLETAHRAGYRPYRFGSENYGATIGGRHGAIFHRGRKGRRWEIDLGMPGESSFSAHLDDFGEAARALLLWLGGADASAVFEQIRGHIIEGTKPLVAAAARDPSGLA